MRHTHLVKSIGSALIGIGEAARPGCFKVIFAVD
jgi:hypothetical protein